MIIIFATGEDLRKKQPHGLIVSPTSSNPAYASIDSLIEIDDTGKHCAYFKDASGTDSKTAQVPRLLTEYNLQHPHPLTLFL